MFPLHIKYIFTNLLHIIRELPSARKLVLVNMPESFSLKELRSISPVCIDLTVEEAQYYGGIPSLIYATKMDVDELSPATRFKRFSRSFKLHKDTLLKAYIYDVLNCIFTGDLIGKSDEINMLGSFASVKEENREIKARWPLVYVSLIIEFLTRICTGSRDDDKSKFIALWSIVDLFRSYKRDMLNIGSGMGWQTLVHALIIMRCMHAYAGIPPLSLFGKFIGDVTSVAVDRMPDVKSLESAKDLIFTTMGPLKLGSVVMFYPQYSSFHGVESFLAYKSSSDKVVVYGIQTKEGQARPNTTAVIPDWVTHFILIRGKAPEKCKPRKDKYIYMSKSQIEDFLGYSLETMYPANWRVH